MNHDNIRDAESWFLESFLEVCEEHKKKCDGDCNVSMHGLGTLYKRLVGRELTVKENKLFM